MDELVVNVRWSRFSTFYFWNQYNRYVAGLDPIFNYAHDPQLYWKYHYLVEDNEVVLLGKTCGAPECTAEMLEDTRTVLQKDFHARFIVLDKRQNPNLLTFLKNNKGFRLGTETENEAAFEVLP